VLQKTGNTRKQWSARKRAPAWPPRPNRFPIAAAVAEESRRRAKRVTRQSPDRSPQPQRADELARLDVEKPARDGDDLFDFRQASATMGGDLAPRGTVAPGEEPLPFQLKARSGMRGRGNRRRWRRREKILRAQWPRLRDTEMAFMDDTAMRIGGPAIAALGDFILAGAGGEFSCLEREADRFFCRNNLPGFGLGLGPFRRGRDPRFHLPPATKPTSRWLSATAAPSSAQASPASTPRACREPGNRGWAWVFRCV